MIPSESTISKVSSEALTIKGKAASQQAFPVNLTAWHTALDQDNFASAALVTAERHLLYRKHRTTGANGNSIDRNDIFAAVKEQVDVQARFLMTMIWGLAGDNRGPSKVAKFFQHANVRDQRTLTAIADNCRNPHNMKTAFTDLNALDGMSTSFVSKFLYFESRGSANTYALIMDDRVAAGLAALHDPWCASCISASAPRPLVTKKSGYRRQQNQINLAWSRYWEYVEGLHHIATQVEVEADDLEVYLFMIGN